MRKTEKTVYRSKIIEYLTQNVGARYYETLKAVSSCPHGYLWEKEYSGRAHTELRNMIKDELVEHKNSLLYLSSDRLSDATDE